MPPRLSKASAHAEIAQRYRERAKRNARHARRPITQAAIRISELTRLFDDQWGRMLLPATDDGYQAARVMAHHIGRLRDAPRRISAWLHTCAPWLEMAQRERLISEVAECPLRWTADKLAWKFGITEATRTRLKLTTIGAIDLSKEQRLARRKLLSKLRKRNVRRVQGAKPRAQYEATSISRTKPWIALGLSRAAWYRTRKPA